LFVHAQKVLGIPRRTIKATVLIETILAAFEMEEILYELRDHIVGLNCGRWDYIFSFIKKFRSRPDFVLPDRSQVTMTVHFLRCYSLELIRVCHRRGAYAMGGMAAQIPIKNDPAANEQALGKVLLDKEREAGDGHDGTWVAHPGLVPIAKSVFDRLMPGPNQLARQRQDVHVTAADLLRVPQGTITEGGVRTNINVGIQYVEAWLHGNGCVPIYNLMEDAATAEISRAQLWQWRKHGCVTSDGARIDDRLLRRLFREEIDKIRGGLSPQTWRGGKFAEARDLFWEMTTSDDFVEFLTLPAYQRITTELLPAKQRQPSRRPSARKPPVRTAQRRATGNQPAKRSAGRARSAASARRTGKGPRRRR
jgi:malate synthase